MQTSLKFNRRLDFFAHKKEFEVFTYKVTLYFDLDKKQLINDTSFFLEGEGEHFEVWENLCAIIIGKDLAFACEVVAKEKSLLINSLNIPYFCFKEMVNEFNNVIKEESFCEKLMCRCFGETYEQINKYVTEDFITDMSEVAKKSMCGKGCGSCLKDFKNYFYSLIKNHNLTGYDMNFRSFRVNGLTQAQVVLRVQSILDELSTQLNVKAVSGNEVFISGDLSNKSMALEYLEKEFSKDLFFIFS